MRVYVETNFVLEIARLQEQYESCSQILSLCEAGDIQLVLPAYSLAEPLEILRRTGSERRDLADRVKREFRQLRRSAAFPQKDDQEIEEWLELLSQSIDIERKSFYQVRTRILDNAEIIPLDEGIFRRISQVEKETGLRDQDAIVLASILQDLAKPPQEPSCFVNRNKRDFDNPEVKDLFSARNCKLLFSFDDAYQYISAKS